ncbi:MAG: type I 3-dehydroquinate dehydratase [Myxococcota bacterium]
MSKIPYCLPLRCNTFQELEHTIQQHDTQFRFFEIWLDALQALSPRSLVKLAEAYPQRLIFLFRRDQLAPMRIPAEQRRILMQTLQFYDVLIDLDIQHQREDIQWWQDHAPPEKLLLSAHDYQCTPEPVKLQELVQTMQAIPSGIYKVATFCNDYNDTQRLMQLILEGPQLWNGKPSVILGMGQAGQATRIFGTLMGNALLFAPRSRNQATANGQHTYAEYQTLFALLAPDYA